MTLDSFRVHSAGGVPGKTRLGAHVNPFIRRFRQSLSAREGGPLPVTVHELKVWTLGQPIVNSLPRGSLSDDASCASCVHASTFTFIFRGRLAWETTKGVGDAL